MNEKEQQDQKISKELQNKIEDLEHVTKNFLIVGSGIKGNFKDGYSLSIEPDVDS